jgi:hypothetical protein
LRPFDSGNCDKAAEAAVFQLRCPLDKSPFILGVVGEHFCSEWYFAGAPRRNVAILFGHRSYATTKQDNEVRAATVGTYAGFGSLVNGGRQGKTDSGSEALIL